ncbi:hypothetical protein Hanom_Chr02g00167361 [Helianthus anomalus]
MSREKMLNGRDEKKRNDIKLLIGSVGSKSNKVVYVRSLLGFLSNLSGLQNSVIWNPATTRVALLYAGADVYIINSQVLYFLKIQVVNYRFCLLISCALCFI